MPKGVEHASFIPHTIVNRIVNFPLMPKGVEHRPDGRQENRTREIVNFPLMPKGVEHLAHLMHRLWN